MSHFLQDMQVGQEIDLGTFTFTADHIKRYAALYDPQPFHMDEEAAKQSHFGALCASGWQTASIWMPRLRAKAFWVDWQLRAGTLARS